MLDAREKALESLRAALDAALPDDVLMPLWKTPILSCCCCSRRKRRAMKTACGAFWPWRNRGCAIWDCRNTRFGNSVRSVRQTV